MICKSVIHVSNSRPEFKFRVHLSPTFRSYYTVNFGTVLRSEIFSITIFDSFAWVDSILFTQLKPSSTPIVDTMVNILGIILRELFAVHSDSWQMAISINFLWQLFIKILLRVNHDVFYFRLGLHYWPSLLLNLLCRTVDYLRQIPNQLFVFAQILLRKFQRFFVNFESFIELN